MNERYFVKSMSRLKLSPQGNPRYKFVVVDRYGDTKILHTSPNAGWVYAITHGWENRMIQAITHETSRNTIVDQAKLAETF